jgi:hypothetical protein
MGDLGILINHESRIENRARVLANSATELLKSRPFRARGILGADPGALPRAVAFCPVGAPGFRRAQYPGRSPGLSTSAPLGLGECDGFSHGQPTTTQGHLLRVLRASVATPFNPPSHHPPITRPRTNASIPPRGIRPGRCPGPTGTGVSRGFHSRPTVPGPRRPSSREGVGRSPGPGSLGRRC